VPVLGLFLGVPAAVCGWRARQRFLADPSVRGHGHAWVGLILGPTEVVVNVVGLALVARGLGWL
jgi:hypothetical protein